MSEKEIRGDTRERPAHGDGSATSERGPYQPRSRKVVSDLTKWLGETEPRRGKTHRTLLIVNGRVHPRVRNLPSLLRRNGLLQTMLFLQGKGEGNANEKLLWQLLKEHLKVGETAADLAKLEAQRYLRLNAQAIEIATLLSRLLDAEAAVAAAQKEQTS